MTSDRRRCADCLHWRRRGDASGECRRNAPTPYYAAGEPVLWGRWPLTVADDFCGEWHARPVVQFVPLPEALKRGPS